MRPSNVLAAKNHDPLPALIGKVRTKPAMAQQDCKSKLKSLQLDLFAFRGKHPFAHRETVFEFDDELTILQRHERSAIDRFAWATSPKAVLLEMASYASEYRSASPQLPSLAHEQNDSLHSLAQIRLCLFHA